MKDSEINTDKLKINKLVYLSIFFLFLILILTLVYRCLFNYKATNTLTIKEFTENRNIYEQTLLPDRGTIYDVKGTTLAQDVSSYTLIAYLDESRSTEDNIRHVKDKENTAKELAKVINLSYEKILERLNKDAYQVEFGSAGKGLSQTKMEEIKNLNLSGIDFIKSTKRYYPNGDFASYLLGYTRNKDIDGNTYMVGELGIEGYYNEELTGTAGYIKYEKDARGNKIANSNEYKQEATNGNNIYLTIDSSIQLFVENAIKKAQTNSQAEWIVLGVMDAKTGAILGYSSTPSFDPNIRNLTNYLDPFVSNVYEPGSTMKTFSYMCAIDSGNYNGTDTFKSGSKTYTSKIDENDKTTIKDWNTTGWGEITYDKGFALSSNIAVANLLDGVITKKELKACYDSFGFGKVTGITLDNELSGSISFTYDVEAATAGYGQGITVSPIQLLQGYSIVANDGIMLKPYIVSKIEDSNGKTILENTRTELGQVVSKETTDKMKELLRSVVSKDSSQSTGSAYYLEGYDLIGKTGTASIFENGQYLTENGQNIYSFAGIYPGDDPEIIVYIAMKKPKDSYNYMAEPIKDIIVNISKYLNIDNSSKKINSYQVSNYKNKTATTVKQEAEKNGIKVITLGTGNKIINQYPHEGINLYKDDLLVLLTNDYDKTMIDFTNLSYKECQSILDLMDVEYSLSGYGYAYTQNINPNEKIKEKIIIELKEPY